MSETLRPRHQQGHYLQHELGVNDTDVLLGMRLEAAKGSNMNITRQERHTNTVRTSNLLQAATETVHEHGEVPLQSLIAI